MGEFPYASKNIKQEHKENKGKIYTWNYNSNRNNMQENSFPWIRHDFEVEHDSL